MILGEKAGNDLFYADLGINRALRESKPKFTLNKNRDINRYLVRQQNRLAKLSKSDKVKFWKLAEHLLRSSKSLRLVALRNVRPNWYKDTQFVRVENWLTQLNQICYRPTETFEINRIGIPKEDGQTRFINDPGVA